MNIGDNLGCYVHPTVGKDDGSLHKRKTPYPMIGGRSCYYAAIPPPALSGSGSRVETLRISSQPGKTRLPVRVLILIKRVYTSLRKCQVWMEIPHYYLT